MSIFKSSAKYVRAQYPLSVITNKWNSSGLGKPATEKTVERWVSGSGPATKNSSFEPFIIGLANICDMSVQVPTPTEAPPRTKLERWLDIYSEVRAIGVAGLHSGCYGIEGYHGEQSAVKRYLGGGESYKDGPPLKFVEFCEKFVEQYNKL